MDEPRRRPDRLRGQQASTKESMVKTGKIDERRLFFPALAKLYDLFAPMSYSFMRFVTGAILVPHGIQKVMLGSAANLAIVIEKQMGVPYPMIWADLAVFNESIVAACLAVGLFTRPAALIISIHMAIITIFFQSQFGYFWTARGYEFALLWCLLCLAIVFKGGGRYSIDRLLGKEF
jgi:putative oxidoreductase